MIVRVIMVRMIARMSTYGSGEDKDVYIKTLLKVHYGLVLSLNV